MPRLCPRDAFYGGRTGVSKMYHKVSPLEKIYYIDYTSLYPCINKYSLYPIGHPQIITQNFKPISEYFGLISCTITPPKDLFHPVLPYRSNNKLIFGLCKLCIETRQNTLCSHSESERSLTGTWVTVEVAKALEMGYVLRKIHEIYHFNEKSDKLFSGYINTFLKLKQEASGFPEGIESDEEKLKYIDDYKNAEGIQLNVNSISVNPGRRAVAKLMLNSFWGKFGQKDEGKMQTVFVSSVADFNKYFTDQKVDVSSFFCFQFHEKILYHGVIFLNIDHSFSD